MKVWPGREATGSLSLDVERKQRVSFELMFPSLTLDFPKRLNVIIEL